MKHTTLILLSLLMTTVSLARAEIVGSWKTIDDESGQPRSIVEISERDGAYYGTVTDLFAKPDDTRCDECKGPRKDQPIVGMEILTDLKSEGEEYAGGQILDPSNGKVYRAKLWLEDPQTLKVRGYLGPFYRTQTWQRAEAE